MDYNWVDARLNEQSLDEGRSKDWSYHLKLNRDSGQVIIASQFFKIQFPSEIISYVGYNAM